MASNLRVDNIQPSTGMGIGIGTANGSVTITGDLSVDTSKGLTVGTGATISGGTNYITASTNGSERLRIDSSGNVGIGTDIPVTSFGYSNLSLANNSGGQIELKRLSSGPNVHYIWGDNHLNIAASYSGSSGDIVFKANGNNERFRVGADGNLQIANGNLVFSTSGTGIDFSATSTDGATVDSELLSDYEEGEWTPTVGGSGGDATATIGNNRCRYIKIGKLVVAYVDFDATISAIGAGQLQVSLPFAVVNPNPKPYCEIFGARNCSMIASETYKVTGWTIENSSRGTFQLSTGTNGAETSVTWGSNVNTSGTPRLCAAFAYYSTT